MSSLKKFGLICGGVFLVAELAALLWATPRFGDKRSQPVLHQEAVSGIITSYVGVQLILSEQIYVNQPGELKEAWADLRHSLGNAALLNVTHIPLGQADDWEAMLSDLQMAAQPIDPLNVKQSRVMFRAVSDRLIRFVEKFGHAHSQPIYVMHCSMAFNDTAADWIQGTNKPRNPYFGKEMLECGTIKKVFPARK